MSLTKDLNMHVFTEKVIGESADLGVSPSRIAYVDWNPERWIDDDYLDLEKGYCGIRIYGDRELEQVTINCSVLMDRHEILDWYVRDDELGGIVTWR